MTLCTLILSDPLSPSASPDTALIDVATGQLAKLEFFTLGGMSFTNTRELSRLAREAIKKANLGTRKGNPVFYSTNNGRLIRLQDQSNPAHYPRETSQFRKRHQELP
jgi:hypothetical protein